MKTLSLLTTFFITLCAYTDFRSHFAQLWGTEFPGKYWIVDLGKKPIEIKTKEQAMKSLDLGEAELRAFGHPMYQAGDFEIKYYLDKDFTKGPIAVDIMGKLIIAGVQIEAIDDYNKSKKPLEEKYGVKFPIDYGMDNFPFQLTPLYTMPSENIKFTHGKLLALDIKEEIAETVAFGRSVYVNLKDL